MTPPAADIPTRRTEMRAGLVDVLPMLVGIAPFGLVAGAAAIDADLTVAHAVGLSVILFAGAAQLAVIEVLDDAGGTAVAIVTALTVNLRLVLYSVSLSPWLGFASRPARLAAAYPLTDQAYALSISRWDQHPDERIRLTYYGTVALTLWAVWQTVTVIGALGGSRVPDDIPLDFAVPLVFIMLLVPVVRQWPSIAAATVGGSVAVLTAQYGEPRFAVVTGGLLGIAAGTIASILVERRAATTGATTGAGR